MPNFFYLPIQASWGGAAHRMGVCRDRPANQEVPDEVITDAKSLLDHATRPAEGADPLPYADALAADLGAAIEAAEAHWNQAGSAADEMAALQAAARASALAFEKDLVAFRRALAATIGRSHPDYQKLRVDRARAVDIDDDPNAPSATEVDQGPDPIEDSQADMMVQEAAE